MDEYGLAYNFASGWDGTNTSLEQYENLLAGSPEYTADGIVRTGLNLFGEDNKLKFEEYFSTKNALSGAAAGPTKENAKLIQDNMLMGMNPEQWGSALKMGQIGIGAGNLGLGLAAYFENKKTADKQRELLGQQIESNRAEIDARKNYRSALEGFGLK